MKRKVIIPVIFVVLIGVISLLGLHKPNTTSSSFDFLNSPTPTPVSIFYKTPNGNQNYQFSSDQQAQIGITSNIAKIAASQTYQNGQTMYKITDSPISNEIITQNGKAIFEKDILLYSPNTDTLTLSEITSQFKPEKIIDYNSYDNSASTYLYPSLGFTIIANPDTGQVYEIQRYIPTTLAKYMATFGKDMQSSTEGIVDHF